MIVRIANEGQYRLEEALHAELNDLDDAVVAAVDAKDEAAFHARFDALLGFIRERGTPLGDDELEGSDVIVPPADLSFTEAGEDFSGEGLIPDPA